VQGRQLARLTVYGRASGRVMHAFVSRVPPFPVSTRHPP
jgi:hypothetical protein